MTGAHTVEESQDDRVLGRPSLAGEQTALTRSRIGRGAMEALARYGFDATVEEIAQLSGVSPRTIFRHFKTHDQLILATVKDIFEACGRPAESSAHSRDDLEVWLRELASTVHLRNAEIVGNAFWDIHIPRADPSEPLGEVERLRRHQRTQGVRHVARLAWRAANGEGEPPDDVVLAFALNFSAFTTHALMGAFDQTPEQIGALTAEILLTVLRRAVRIQGD
jgi:AcrR family transcriptional regulator